MIRGVFIGALAFLGGCGSWYPQSFEFEGFNETEQQELMLGVGEALEIYDADQTPAVRFRRVAEIEICPNPQTLWGCYSEGTIQIRDTEEPSLTYKARHEYFHALLEANTGDVDGDHTLPMWAIIDETKEQETK